MDQAGQTTDTDATGSGANSGLRLKLRRGEVARQANVISLPKALRLSLAKVADTQMNLALAVLAIKVEEVENDALEQVFDDAGLMMLLDGNRARRGAAVFDADLVGGLIQQQTMGKVAPVTGGTPRTLTDTDAAICTPFLEGVLANAAPMPDLAEEGSLLDGYSFGARMVEARLLRMALGQPRYKVVHITVDLAGGARQGRIILCLPLPDETDVQMSTQGAEAPVVQSPPKTLTKTVMALEADLYVSLGKLKLSLGAVQGMAPGDCFDLGITAFDGARVQTKEGRHLASGTLGQIDGTRALQIEHSTGPTHLPRRRAADRATLDLPNVAGDGTGTQADGARRRDERGIEDAQTVEGSLAQNPASRADDAPRELPLVAPELSAPQEAPLPDMSDLAGLEDVPDLVDLPDMSDLPGLSEDV